MEPPYLYSYTFSFKNYVKEVGIRQNWQHPTISLLYMNTQELIRKLKTVLLQPQNLSTHKLPHFPNHFNFLKKKLFSSMNGTVSFKRPPFHARLILALTLWSPSIHDPLIQMSAIESSLNSVQYKVTSHLCRRSGMTIRSVIPALRYASTEYKPHGEPNQVKSTLKICIQLRLKSGGRKRRAVSDELIWFYVQIFLWNPFL